MSLTTLAYLICGDGTFTGHGILISADNFFFFNRRKAYTPHGGVDKF